VSVNYFSRLLNNTGDRAESTRKGLISSYKKVDGLHGVKYEILLPDKKQRGIEGLEKTIEGPEILQKR